MAGGNSIQKRERARCAGIVRDRRATVERRLISSRKMNEDQKMVVRRVITLLQEIEHSILELPHPDAYMPEKFEYLGDFSAEEMERAQAIIEEQEHNPFEG